MERASRKKDEGVDLEWYETLRDLHYALLQTYVNIIYAVERLPFFTKLPSVYERDPQRLNDLNALIQARMPGWYYRPFREAWKIALRAEVTPIKLPIRRGPAPADREALSGEEQVSKKVRIGLRALPKRIVYSTKDVAENVAFPVVYKPYSSIARFLVLRPLIRRFVRLHIRARLAKLRSLYIAKRSVTPASTHIGETNRKILSDLIEDTSDFLQRNEDISKFSRGRAEVQSAIGGLVNFGLPGGVALLVANWLSKINVVQQAFSYIATGNIEWSRLNVGLAIGSIAGVIVALLFLALFIWTQMLAFEAKRSLLSGAGSVIFGQRMGDEGGPDAYKLEGELFRALEMSPPQEDKYYLKHSIVYATGLLLGILGFLASG